MTYYNDYEILNEADEQQTQQQGIGKEKFNNILGEYVARDRQRANLSVKLKLTHSLFDAIEFPAVPANFKNLMVKSYFPEKFLNVNNALDPDPSATIDNATDFAVKSFSGIGTLSLAPQGVKEELEYIESKALNESIGSLAFTIGKITGTTVSQTVGGGIAGVATGVAQTVGAPMAAAAGAAVGLGALSARLSPDSAGNYHENDKKLLQKYGLEKNSGKTSNNKDTIQAIDNYINSIQAVIRTLLLQVASKTSKANINKLMSTINKLNAGALGKATEWIDAHREEIVKYSEYRAKNEQRKYEQASIANNNLVKLINWLQSHPDKETAEVRSKIKKLAGAGTDKLANISQSIIDVLPTEESVNFNFAHVLNEAENEVDNSAPTESPELPEFNADIIYETVLRNIQESINQILEADPEEWPKVIWAKERMQELKKGATEQINKQIEIVCRMSNGENMPKGLSGTVTDFIVKHPMRAENLKALWKRHESDLDLRIQRRINAITNPTGPCEAVYTFLQTTYPTLMAMMITYKALLVFMRENDETLMRPMNDTYKKNVAAEIQQVQNSALNNFKLAYDLAGGYLNKASGEQTLVYDLKQNIFTADLNYGGAVVYYLFKKYKRKDVATQYEIYMNQMDELLPKDADTYFNKMACVLGEVGNIADATNISTLIGLMDTIGSEKDKMFALIEKLNQNKEKILAHRKEHLENLLKLILATRGEFINYYNDNKGDWKGIKAMMDSSYAYSFQHKDDKGKVQKLDKNKDYHDITGILSKYSQALAKAKYDIKTIINGLNKEQYFNTIFQLYYGLFLNLLTNVQGKSFEQLAFIDYDLVSTMIDMLSSELPKLVSTECDMGMDKLDAYAEKIVSIINDGYDPSQDEEGLFGYPEIKPEEIDKYQIINNLLNDNEDLPENADEENEDKSGKNQLGPGAQYQFSSILKNVLDTADKLADEVKDLNIPEEYKFDPNNEYTKSILDRTHGKIYDFLTKKGEARAYFNDSEHIDELLDAVKIILHNCIIVTFKKFNESASVRINFNDVWDNTQYDIRKENGKNIKLTLSQICNIVTQVEDWLDSPTLKGTETEKNYNDLKSKCNEQFRQVFDIEDTTFNLFDLIGSRDNKGNKINIQSANDFKNALPAEITPDIINGITAMFADINTSSKCELFRAFFDCVCQTESESKEPAQPAKEQPETEQK